MPLRGHKNSWFFRKNLQIILLEKELVEKGNKNAQRRPRE